MNKIPNKAQSQQPSLSLNSVAAQIEIALPEMDGRSCVEGTLQSGRLIHCSSSVYYQLTLRWSGGTEFGDERSMGVCRRTTSPLGRKTLQHRKNPG
ncbi:hypothetical protein NIES4101_34030 [Calothrix sp. NIES-4101]|nr:hypothetical protein NIES4101_34030 [Calothrix sp. NIES-4101]